MDIRNKDTRPCPSLCSCPCNSLTWVTRPSHTPVC
ncbi:hypothetical protein F383_29268 [Gossypium arboreum]|uniref:Uncharacterized protein n=1 Tax=Gossypium arboreum TaxID=29729 RepID=A0A0B0N060_GOSAR|nr:hypothetical protein F383_29268 [Gossypium arboreum]